MSESRTFFRDKIITIVGTELMIDVFTKNRKREIIEARAMCYYFLRENMNMPYQEIADVFDKNHASVIHAVKSFPYMMLANSQLATSYENVRIKVDSMTTKFSKKEKREFFLMKEVQKLRDKVNELRRELKQAKEVEQC